MEMSDKARRAFEVWTGPESWLSNHAFDEERFHDFVVAHWKGRGTTDPERLREELFDICHKKGWLDPEKEPHEHHPVFRYAREFENLLWFLDFLEKRGHITREE